MPGVRDKIIINNLKDEGNHSNIMKKMEALRGLGEEVAERGLLKKAQDIKARMKKDCKTFNDAQVLYCSQLDGYIDELDALIDTTL